MNAEPIRVRVITLVLVILVLSIASSAVQAQGPQPEAVIASSAANFRAGPGLNFDVVGGAYHGDRFPVIARAQGTNRVWYQVVLPGGQLAWISERVVTIVPSADGIPWLADNPVIIPYVMDCGTLPPVLYVGASGTVTHPGTLNLQHEPGYGKTIVGQVAYGETFVVLGGPECTRLSEGTYQVEWLVQTSGGLVGYLRERWPDGSGGYSAYVALNPAGSGGATGGAGTALQIGVQAQVFVLDEGLKLRAGPGTNFAVIETLPSGTIVQVLDGPAQAGGYTWWYVRAPSGNTGWCVGAVDNIQTLVPLAAQPQSAIGGRSPQVTNAHIEQAQAIQRDVASGLINETQAEQQLNRLVSEIGADGLAWITRRVPIYDGQTGRWISFGQYADNMVDDAGVDPDTRFAQDPVGTTADLMFGNYESVDEIIEWLGLDDW